MIVTNVTKALLWAGLAFCPLEVAAGKPAKAPAEVPMCVLFDDLAGDGVRSDDLGPYCDSDYDVSAYSVGGFALSTKDQDRVGPEWR